jgi:hypothetical protein
LGWMLKFDCASFSSGYNSGESNVHRFIDRTPKNWTDGRGCP